MRARTSTRAEQPAASTGADLIQAVSDDPGTPDDAAVPAIDSNMRTTLERSPDAPSPARRTCGREPSHGILCRSPGSHFPTAGRRDRSAVGRVRSGAARSRRSGLPGVPRRRSVPRRRGRTAVPGDAAVQHGRRDRSRRQHRPVPHRQSSPPPAPVRSTAGPWRHPAVPRGP
ncbi:hypothetical protein ACFFX0_05205 [Citricoccus parietis]|uniref:Uncharacterized protein n=1 Tax=Citricoccus parietis TaxID=592307 RepID=A0ABV5FVD0_9MICC